MLWRQRRPCPIGQLRLRGADRPIAANVRLNAGDVENQHQPSVAELGRAGNAVDPEQRIGDRLDDDFALAGDAIDQQSDRRRAGADHESRASAGASAGLDREQPRQPDHRQRAAAIRHQLVVSRSRAASADVHFDDFPDRRLRNGKRVIADLDDDRVGDRQRQRQRHA